MATMITANCGVRFAGLSACALLLCLATPAAGAERPATAPSSTTRRVLRSDKRILFYSQVASDALLVVYWYTPTENLYVSILSLSGPDYGPAKLYRMTAGTPPSVEYRCSGSLEGGSTKLTLWVSGKQIAAYDIAVQGSGLKVDPEEWVPVELTPAGRQGQLLFGPDETEVRTPKQER